MWPRDIDLERNSRIAGSSEWHRESRQQEEHLYGTTNGPLQTNHPSVPTNDVGHTNCAVVATANIAQS